MQIVKHFQSHKRNLLVNFCQNKKCFCSIYSISLNYHNLWMKKCKSYSIFSIFLMLLLSSHRVFNPVYSSKPSILWKPLWCKYSTVFNLGVMYNWFCLQCSWKKKDQHKSINQVAWMGALTHTLHVAWGLRQITSDLFTLLFFSAGNQSAEATNTLIFS